MSLLVLYGVKYGSINTFVLIVFGIFLYFMTTFRTYDNVVRYELATCAVMIICDGRTEFNR